MAALRSGRRRSAAAPRRPGPRGTSGSSARGRTAAGGTRRRTPPPCAGRPCRRSTSTAIGCTPSRARSAVAAGPVVLGEVRAAATAACGARAEPVEAAPGVVHPPAAEPVHAVQQPVDAQQRGDEARDEAGEAAERDAAGEQRRGQRRWTQGGASQARPDPTRGTRRAASYSALRPRNRRSGMRQAVAATFASSRYGSPRSARSTSEAGGLKRSPYCSASSRARATKPARPPS